MAGGAGGGGGARDGDGVAGGAVPRGDAVAPPELARDAPVVDVGHPLHVGFAVHLGDELDMAVGDGDDGVGGDGESYVPTLALRGWGTRSLFLSTRVVRSHLSLRLRWGTRFCGRVGGRFVDGDEPLHGEAR